MTPDGQTMNWDLVSDSNTTSLVGFKGACWDHHSNMPSNLSGPAPSDDRAASEGWPCG